MENIGIDVAKKNSQICILTEGGELIEFRFRTSREGFAAVLGKRPRAKVLIEACGESEWIARCIEELGHEVIVGDPGYGLMYGARGNGIKTDRRDARALAEALRVGAYRAAHRLSENQRRLRRYIVTRENLVRARTNFVVVVQALLRQDGLRVPTGSAEHLERRLAAIEIPGHLMSAIAPTLAALQVINRQIKFLDEIIAIRVEDDARAMNLRSMPQIGPLTAATFVNAVDDPARFEGPHKLEAFLGLVPRERSSGELKRRGAITKVGSARARTLLVSAAVRIRRHKDPRLKSLWSWADKIAERRGKKVAMIALARRIAGVLFAMMRDGTTYQDRCDAAATATAVAA